MEIFDSLTHPTIDKTWLNTRFSENCDLDLLVKDMEKFKIKKAFAVGLKGVGSYNLEKYIEFLKPYKNFIPIAFCEPEYDFEKLFEIKNLGYGGIKIHPRISGIEIDDDRIFNLIKYANKIGLIVLYCGFLGVTDKFVEKIGDEKIIFLHTGGKDLAKTFEKLKDKKNILLDLSYTFNKYPQLDFVLQDLFKNHSERICVGSDNPEVNLRDFINKFKLFIKDLEFENVEKIAYKNIELFMLQ